jgi:fructokinase
VKIISIGEILWDIFPEGEYLGGAPFNFAAHAARLGHDVTFISAVGDDERGRLALQRMRDLNLSTAFTQVIPHQATGTVSVTLDDGQPAYTIHRPAAYDFVDAPTPAPRADWVCFGTLHQMSEHARSALDTLLAANPEAQRLYDVNLRKDSYTIAVIERLMDRATILKLNETEQHELERLFRSSLAALRSRFGWRGVCVTRGERGCTIGLDNGEITMPALKVRLADAVGAGDAFAAALVHGISANWPIERVARFANALGGVVASRPGAVPDWSAAELELLL